MTAPRTKLFVGHLPDGVTNEDLQSLFEKYGTVTECDVINKYGFVHMISPEAAQEAINGLNNSNYRGATLSVEQSKSRLHPAPGAPGRAKGGENPNFRGGFSGGRGSFRGGPPRGRGGYSNGYNGMPYGDRGGDFMDRYGGGPPRMRPYPSPYDRAPMGPPRDGYDSYRSPPSMRDPYASPRDPYAARDPYAGSRPDPYGAGSRDPYAMRPPMTAGRDMYDRRPTAYPATQDYLYSRRSPPPSSTSARWYSDSYGDASSSYWA